MDDRRSFLNAIIETPHDDTVRLAFADWLDENGDKNDRVHAEFIRIQIELGDGPRKTTGLSADAHRNRLIRRERKILREHGPRWFEETVAPMYVKYGCASWSHGDIPQESGWMVLHGMGCVQRKPFRRGLIENWTFQYDQFIGAVTFGSEPFRRHPITSVCISLKMAASALFRSGYFWVVSSEGRTSSNINNMIFNAGVDAGVWKMAPHGSAAIPVDSDGDGFATHADADAHLSAACVALGRSCAGLPPLSPNVLLRTL